MNIALGVQPLQLQLPDPNAGMNALMRAMQIKNAMSEGDLHTMQADEYKRGVERKNKMFDVLGGQYAKPEDREEALLRGGFVEEAGKLSKDRREGLKLENESARARAETQKAELETALKKTEHVSSVLSLAKDPASYATVRAVIQQQFGLPLPEQFDPNTVNAMVAQGQTLTQRLQAEHQRMTLEETGRHNRTTEVETGRHNTSTEGIQRGQLAVSQGQLGETRRHNGTMEGFRSSEVAQGRVPAGYRPSVDGKGLEFIPGGPADPNTARRAAPTEDERKAAGWVAQARFAYDNMEKAIKSDPTAARPGVLESIPGMPENTANMTRSPARQQFNQAASSFAEAALRAATGAGVNKDEAQQKIRELTPQWGDKQPVIEQKKAALHVYLNALETRAGNALRSVQQPPAGGGGNDVFSRADAILNGGR